MLLPSSYQVPATQTWALKDTLILVDALVSAEPTSTFKQWRRVCTPTFHQIFWAHYGSPSCKNAALASASVGYAATPADLLHSRRRFLRPGTLSPVIFHGGKITMDCRMTAGLVRRSAIEE